MNSCLSKGVISLPLTKGGIWFSLVKQTAPTLFLLTVFLWSFTQFRPNVWKPHLLQAVFSSDQEALLLCGPSAILKMVNISLPKRCSALTNSCSPDSLNLPEYSEQTGSPSNIPFPRFYKCRNFRLLTFPNFYNILKRNRIYFHFQVCSS